VLELSSFQLEDLARIGRSPHTAIVTCISPNHLDRHETMQGYIDAKKNILRFQGAGDAAVLNADDKEVRRWKTEAHGRTVLYSTRRPRKEGVFADGTTVVFRLDGREERVDLAGRITLLGRHNMSNILAAAAGARLLDVPPEMIADAVAAFRPLAHRLQPVGRRGGVLFVNDSKATTPLAARVSMESFDAPIVLIAGGRDKHMDMGPMVRAIRRRAKAVVLIGEMAAPLHAAIGRRGPPVERAATIEDAVALAAAAARSGDVVLLAPGYTSWDMFNNYEERGEAFRRAALSIGMEPLGQG
jgi:UDP-N-acetylmuramoylalanine--D-glutamate ligase